MDITKKKIIFIDMDGTLIDTASGKTFPEGIWDMKLKMEVFKQLKKISPKAVIIVTNQGGIEMGYLKIKVLIYISTLEILPSSEGFLFNYT